MNTKGNQLKRGKISSNKITGKIKENIDLNIILDQYSGITDMNFEYYNSKFQFTDFYNKVIQDYNWIGKPRFLLENKAGKYYTHSEKGLEMSFYHLISLYQDLDTCLQRLYDGYHDSCFIRFALEAGIFTTEHHWQMLMRNWYLGFSMALRRYYNACHPQFDVTSNISYSSYFDTHFSKYLYFAIGRADQERSEHKVNLNTNQYIRLDQIHESHSLYQELFI